LVDGGCTTVTGRPPARNLATSSTGRTLRRTVQQHVQPVERDGKVCTTFRPGDGVDLVDDDGPDAGQHLPGSAGQQQEQRLRGGDQDVRTVAGEDAPITRRGVTGSHRDRDLRWADAGAGRDRADPGERGPQVPFHVDGQRLQRRQVQHRAPLGRGCGGVGSGHEIVDRREERGERLAGPGRRHHQGVIALPDGIPGTGLSGRRLGERRGEPVPDQWVEPIQGSGRPIVLNPPGAHSAIVLADPDSHPSVGSAQG
jgi:hypothetical protein